MISYCANPGCGKVLHYLREGRIFAFDLPTGGFAAGGKRLHRLEHFWLCGECSGMMTLVHEPKGVRVVPKPGPRIREEMKTAGSILAS